MQQHHALELLRRVATTCKTPEEVADKMEKIGRFRSALELLQNNRRRLVEDYDKRLRGVDKEITTLQNTCDHSVIKHHGDPSGNNDSYEECLICGKEEVRFKRK